MPFSELSDISDQNADQPMTIAEQLDAAQTGEEFGNVILGLFGHLDQMRSAE